MSNRVLYRFSWDGFEPKNQTFHRKMYKDLVLEPNLSHLPDYTQKLILEEQERMLPHIKAVDWNHWKSGVFVFVDKLPDEREIQFLLNHMKRKDGLMLWRGEVDNDAVVYLTDTGCFCHKTTIASLRPGRDCYLPETKIENVEFIRSFHETC